MVAVLVRGNGNGKFSGFGAGSSGGRNESRNGSSSATPFASFSFVIGLLGFSTEHL
ncbi:hypothetical protein DEO72_LG3g1959 [Vigna unguiculata]|uniref:Uncharacterized protein n=1 Tax=Vigna unguiculata TaxID=3917 RepID=A0A4D6LG06_VIGUN|nr:hypothetical protein DEO72_LG3g1959 [Vigna unguiculata]